MLASLQHLPSLRKPAPDVKSPGQRILELDGLRGLAILEVIARHYGVTQFSGGENLSAVAFFNHLCQRLSGVDLFFVITGFLLGSHLLASVDSPRYYSRFYLRRCCRTFPLYYLVLLFVSTAVLARNTLYSIFGFNFEWPFGTPWSLIAYTLFLQNFWCVASASFGSEYLGIAWSLAVQEQFYLFLPAVLRCGTRRRLGFVLASLFLLAPLSRLVIVSAVPVSRWSWYDRLLCCQMDTLATGVFTAWLLQSAEIRDWLRRVRSLLCPIAAVLFLSFTLLVHSEYEDGRWATVVFVVRHTHLAFFYVFLVLSARFASQGVVGAILRLAVLRELGRISYGLYLFHQMVNLLVSGMLFGAPPRSLWLGGWQTWLAALGAFMITVIIAEFSWHLLEKPLIAWSKST